MSPLPEPNTIPLETRQEQKPQGGKHDSRFRLVPLDAPTNLVPRPYVVQDLIFEKSAFMIYGAPQAGKSFLALDLILSAGAGLDWMGHEVGAGLAVYVASEGRDGISRRTAGWKAQHPNVDASLALHLEGADFNLLDSAHADDLIAKIIEMGAENEASPKLVVIDTLSSAIPGADENNQAPMSIVMSHLRRISEKTGAAVGLVHHVAKSNPRDPRGNNVLTAGMDTTLLVAERSNRRVMEVVKQRDGPTGAKIAFSLVPVSVRCTDDTTATTCVPSVRSTASQEHDTGDNTVSTEDEALLEFSQDIVSDRDKYMAESSGDDIRLNLSDVKKRAIENYYRDTANLDTKRKRFERSLNRLEASGMIRREENSLVIIARPEAPG